jgi:TolB protein
MQMIRLLTTLAAATLLAAALFVGRVTAQNQATPAETPPSGTPTIRIVGSARQRVPIALPAFDGGGGGRGQDAALSLHDVMRDDLLFSGYFQIVPDEYLKMVGPFRDRPASYKEWQGIGAEAILTGSAQPEGLSGIVFEGQVFETTEQRAVIGKRFRGDQQQVRIIAHKMSDAIVEHYMGKPGIATTRIAYVSQVGKGKEIFVMDYDGARPKRITANGSMNRSPAWSPDGRLIAFVSLRSGSPELLILDASGDLQRAFPQKGELNSAPAWSPDGRLLAFSSARDGNAEIYTLGIDDKVLTRLTRDPGIDTSPTWSPDGRSIAFTSDRTGSPQIYLMDADGGRVRPLTHELSYCDAASWSPNPDEGDRIAFAARVPGGFDIFSYDLKTAQLTRLTDGGGINESPRWSPDGRHLVFASDRSGGSDIYTMDANGDHVRRLTRGGSNQMPSWSR